MTPLVQEPWRIAVCYCGHETAWRHEYSGGQMWLVIKNGDTCEKCGRIFTKFNIKFTQEQEREHK